MNKDTFNKLVEKEADRRVQVKLSKFKNGLEKLIKDLGFYVGGSDVKTLRTALREYTPLTDPNKTGWSNKIWDDERKQVEKELLQTMNIVQQISVSEHEKTEKPIWEIVDGAIFKDGKLATDEEVKAEFLNEHKARELLG